MILFNFAPMEKKKFTPPILNSYAKYFKPEKLWEKLKKYGRIMGKELVFYVLVLYYAMKSPKTPLMHKLMIAGALGYLILPLDFIPDSMPIIGYTDDLAAITTVLSKVSSSITPEIEARAREKVNQWFNKDNLNKEA